MAEGYVMTIPKSVLNKLDQADQKIAKIAETSQKTQKTFVNAFQEMTNGVDPLLQKLRELKSLSRVKLDKIFGNASTTAEKTANSVAQVATQLNRVAESPMDTVNRKIQSLRDLLDQSVIASQKMQNQMAAINQGSGSISGNTLKEGNAGGALTIQIQAELKALELERNLLQQNDRYWKQYIDNLNGSSIASQRQKAEMDKLNSTFRSGSSLLQQQAKAEDDLAKSTDKEAKAADRAAKAEARKNAARSKKESQAAARAEEQYERALNKSEVTITQRARKIEALANAQRALTATGKNYADRINRIASETLRLETANEKAAASTKKLKSSQSKILDLSEQLKRQLALAFSVSAIKGYVDKLVQVRGEFELQQTALRSILQDKEKADQVWNKTVQLAVKSPFTVKELVTYTKQLAAYRIESDKLYDTNKMLADVSAGLGISMDRLILAFGQVKAANYLRASEVRQFTEAGVNILGELSTIYTELEGRMVSVAEVQDRITKRMVKFGDVEEVFKRITSAGGIFYNMQEVQAETLAGMMSNLQDTFDLMFNEIGKANDGVLKGFVSMLKDIVNNWERIAQVAVPIIMTLLSRWVLLKGSAALAELATGKFVKTSVGGLKLVSLSMMKTTAATQRMTSMIKQSSGASIFGGWVTILSAVAVVAWEIYNAISATYESQRKMNKTISEGVQTASEMAQKFKILASEATDSTKSVDEQKKALDELKRTYGDVISAEQLTIENLKKMKGNYDAVTTAIYAKIKASTKEKLLAQVQEEEGEVANDALEGLRANLVKFGVTSGTARQMVNELSGEIRQGLINSPDEAVKKVQKLIAKYTLLDSTILGLDKRYTTWGSILTYQSMNAYLRLEELIKKSKELDELELGPLEFGDLPDANLMNKMFNSIEEEVEKWKKENKDKLSPFDFSEGAKKFAIQKYEELIKELESSLKGEGSIKIDSRSIQIATNFIYKAKQAIEDLKGTVQQREIERLLIESFTKVKASFEAIPNLLLGDKEGMDEYVKRIKQRIEYLKEEIDLFNKNHFLSPFATKPEKIEEFKKEQQALMAYILNFPQTNKEQKKGENEKEKRLKKQLSLLKEIGKVYEDNLKYYNKEEAAAKTRADYSSAAKQAGISDYVATMTFDTGGLVKAITDVGKQASGDVKLEFERAIADINGKADLDVRIKGLENTKQLLEDAFSGYELSVELDSNGIFNKDALMKMFGVSYKSLDELKELLKNTYPDVSKLSEEQTKNYKYYLEKIRDFENKDHKARLKEAEKFFTSTLDLAKKAQLESAREISGLTDLYNNGVISTEQYTSGMEQSIKKVSDAMSKVSLDKLKESPEFIQAMGTMAGYSSNELAKLAQRLRELADDSSASMTVEDITKLYDIINKVEQKSEKVKSPFKKSVWSDLKQIISLQKDYNKELDNYNKIRENIELLESKKKDVKTQMNTLQSSDNFGISGIDKDEMASLQEEYGLITDNITSANSQLGQSGQKLEGIKGKLDGATGGMGAAMGMIDKIVTGIYQSINATIDLMNQFKELAESNGIDTSKGGWREAQQAGEVLGNVNEKVMSSWNNFKSGNFAGAIADAVGSITTIFTTFNKQHDARREKRIQEEIKLVNKLSKAYEHLSRQIENAYTIDTLNMSYENAERNLEQQMESTKRMIAAEQDKKDSDQDKIDEWNNELINYQEKLEDLRAQKIQELGGFGSGSAMASAAEEFASAWLDAYRETGDGLDALSDKWDDFIQNIIIKQLALKGVNKFLEPIMTMIDQAIGPDGNLSTEELEKIQAAIKKTIPGMNEFYKTLYESFGDALPKPENTTELSGLQTGIQGVTEETAGIIEGYLNSIRFFVADSNMQLQTIALFFSSDPSQNPMYSEMMAQTRLLRSIDDRLASVITSAGNHPLSGFAIKSII